MTPFELEQLKIELQKKWPEPPPKFSREWFQYRGDQSYYRMKRDELKIKYGKSRSNGTKELVQPESTFDPIKYSEKIFSEETE